MGLGAIKALKRKKQSESGWNAMNATEVLELVLIKTPMLLKNDYKRSRSRPTLAKEAGFKDKNKCAYQIKTN